jgi:hypothetical protein
VHRTPEPPSGAALRRASDIEAIFSLRVVSFFILNTLISLLASLPIAIIYASFTDYFIPSVIIVYSLIFIYLIIKLLFRTYKFSQITNILYTRKGLVIGNKIFHYEEDEKLKNLLLDYEKLFYEYLSKPSKLSKNIKHLRQNIIKNFEKILDYISKDNKLDLIAFFILIIYGIGTIILYYIGFILGFFLIFESRSQHHFL